MINSVYTDLKYLFVFIAFFCLSFSLYGFIRDAAETDSTDNIDGQRSGLKLYTDYGTGCEYLATVRGGLFPRIADDGVTHAGCDS